MWLVKKVKHSKCTLFETRVIKSNMVQGAAVDLVRVLFYKGPQTEMPK